MPANDGNENAWLSSRSGDTPEVVALAYAGYRSFPRDSNALSGR